jgi:hypothetical protein
MWCFDGSLRHKHACTCFSFSVISIQCFAVCLKAVQNDNPGILAFILMNSFFLPGMTLGLCA